MKALLTIVFLGMFAWVAYAFIEGQGYVSFWTMLGIVIGAGITYTLAAECLDMLRIKRNIEEAKKRQSRNFKKTTTKPQNLSMYYNDFLRMVNLEQNPDGTVSLREEKHQKPVARMSGFNHDKFKRG